MPCFTVFDNTAGLRWKHSNEIEVSRVDVEQFIILDNGQVSLPAIGELFVVHRVKRNPDGVLTWIGLYRAAPLSSTNRTGDYCGVGLWLRDKTITGSDVTGVLSNLMNAAVKAMRASSRQAWDITKVTLDRLIDNIPELNVTDIDPKLEFGRDTVCIDASDGIASSLDDVLNQVLKDRSGRFDRFGRILLSKDPEVLKAVASKHRIPVGTMSEIRNTPVAAGAVRMRNEPTVRPRPLEAQSPTSSRAPANESRPYSDGNMAEVSRQVFETKRASARMEDLFGIAEGLESRVAQVEKKVQALLASGGGSHFSDGVAGRLTFMRAWQYSWRIDSLQSQFQALQRSVGLYQSRHSLEPTEENRFPSRGLERGTWTTYSDLNDSLPVTYLPVTYDDLKGRMICWQDHADRSDTFKFVYGADGTYASDSSVGNWETMRPGRVRFRPDSGGSFTSETWKLPDGTFESRFSDGRRATGQVCSGE